MPELGGGAMRFRPAVVLVVLLALVSVSFSSTARAENPYSPFGGEPSSAKKVTFWSLVVSGVALHAVSIFSFVQAGSLGGQRDEMIRANGGDPTTFAGPAECRTVSECVALRAKNDDIDAASNRALVTSLVGSGLMLGGLVTLFVWPSERAKATGVRVSPSVGMDGARVSVGVRF